MSGYALVKLDDLMNLYKEDKVRSILSSFSCPMNLDVECFLRDKAILFSNQGIAKVHLGNANWIPMRCLNFHNRN